MKKTLSIVKVVIPLVITALIGGMIVMKNITVIENISVPPWYPPMWFFPVAWTAVLSLLGWGYWLSVNRPENPKSSAGLRDTAAAFYYLQLFLNFFWVYLFFGLGFFWVAFAEVLFLIYFTGKLILTVFKINRKAALLMLPYFIQTVFGGIGLNLFIALMN